MPLAAVPLAGLRVATVTSGAVPSAAVPTAALPPALMHVAVPPTTVAADASAGAPAGLEPSWEGLLTAQDQVLSRRQALEAGMSGEAWEWRLARTWQAPAPGVAIAHRGPASQRQRAWTAVLLCGPGACLTGTWALAEQGWTAPDLGAVDVLVPEHRRVEPRVLQPSGLLVRPRRFAGLDAACHPVRVPPVVRPATAALHAAAWAPTSRAAEWRVASVVQQRLTTTSALRNALEGLPRLPRRALLRAVLADVELGAHARTELDLLAFLRRHHLPRPDRLQLRERGEGVRYLDAWWERPRVVVEVDGAHHRLVGQWEADLLRANAVQVDHRDDRVLLLRVTGGQLRHDAEAVAQQLRAVLTS